LAWAALASTRRSNPETFRPWSVVLLLPVGWLAANNALAAPALPPPSFAPPPQAASAVVTVVKSTRRIMRDMC